MAEKCGFHEPTLEKQLKGHRNSITALFFSPSEQQIASSSLDNSVMLWELRGALKSYRFQGHIDAVMDVTFSPSGKFMASASCDKTVRLWVPTVAGSAGVFKAHSQTVRSVQFSPDGKKLITASNDKIVKLWATDKHKFLASFAGHTNWVRCARMSSDGSVIASCSDDKTTRLWNPDTGECLHTYKDHKGHSTYLAWHPSGCYVAVGTSEGNVKLYDVRTQSLVQYYSIHNGAVTQLAFHPSGSYILTSSKDGTMKILDLLEGQPMFTLSGHNGAVNSVNFSPSGDLFASAGDDKLMFIWKNNFTELTKDMKENVSQNAAASSASNKTSTVKTRHQGKRVWHLCYHSNKYPVTTFIHLDDGLDVSHESLKQSSFEEPNANSTLITDLANNSGLLGRHVASSNNIPESVSKHSVVRNASVLPGDLDAEDYSVGHMSHIPRKPPTPTTYTIPSFMNKSMVTEHCGEQDDLFGMIKLRDNDVCYTSGSIEWVGRKRSFPINSGFKIINENFKQGNEPSLKQVRRLDKTFTVGIDSKIKECDCANVLPTMNAIVDHLNALHEAVDLVDLRLNTLEDVIEKY